MGIFGWSYPPGCSGPPDQDDEPCIICGGDPCGDDGCKCPVCPVSVCQAQGYEDCVTSHGFINWTMNQEHIRLWTEAELVRKSEREAEQAWAEWEIQQDLDYQEAHPFPHDEPPYDEHDDSAFQCGKDW